MNPNAIVALLAAAVCVFCAAELALQIDEMLIVNDLGGSIRTARGVAALGYGTGVILSGWLLLYAATSIESADDG